MAPPGSARGGAAVKLKPDGEDATLLDYTAHAQVGGKLAQIGSRLIDGTARKMADDFFAKFTQVVGQPETASEAVAPAPPEAPPPDGQLAARPAAAFSPAPPIASPAEISDPPVDMRLVAMVGAAVVAFMAILFMVAGA